MAAGVSVREFAKRVGVTHPAVLAAIKRGRITTKTDGTIDYKKASVQWEANRDPSKARGTTTPGAQRTPAEQKVAASYATSRAAREHYDARIREAEYKRMIGELVPLEDVRRAAFDTGRRTRDLLLTVPQRVGPVVAGLTDPAECARVIEQEIRRACDELTQRLAGGKD